MRPTDLVTLRGVPVWRIRQVTLLGREVELAYERNMDVQDGPDSAEGVLGEVLIDAGDPTGALHDVIAVDFDPPGVTVPTRHRAESVGARDHEEAP
jgi:alpha-L-fucosidase